MEFLPNLHITYAHSMHKLQKFNKSDKLEMIVMREKFPKC